MKSSDNLFVDYQIVSNPEDPDDLLCFSFYFDHNAVFYKGTVVQNGGQGTQILFDIILQSVERSQSFILSYHNHSWSTTAKWIDEAIIYRIGYTIDSIMA